MSVDLCNVLAALAALVLPLLLAWWLVVRGPPRNKRERIR